MVLNYGGHREAVAGWMSQAGKGLSNDDLVELLEQALRAVWAAAQPNVSEVTLAAVLDRALINAADAYPSLPRATIDDGEADLAAMRAAAPRLKRETLKQAIEYIVTDFVAILGNLTAETLSKGLQAKLAAVRVKRKRGG